jgi:hypothetical protein
MTLVKVIDQQTIAYKNPTIMPTGKAEAIKETK